MNPDPAERWVIILRDAGGSEQPIGRRVAGLLKSALRAWKLRCIEASSMTLDEQVQRLRAELAEVREQLRKAQRPRKREAATHGMGKCSISDTSSTGRGKCGVTTATL